MVAWAIRRARHAGSSPACNRRHNRGSRWHSSNASAIRSRPDSVGNRNAPAKSAIANSPTRGVPSPARTTGRSACNHGSASCSSSTDSAGCSTAHATANASSRASSRSRAARVSRTASNTPQRSPPAARMRCW